MWPSLISYTLPTSISFQLLLASCQQMLMGIQQMLTCCTSTDEDTNNFPNKTVVRTSKLRAGRRRVMLLSASSECELLNSSVFVWGKHRSNGPDQHVNIICLIRPWCVPSKQRTTGFGLPESISWHLGNLEIILWVLIYLLVQRNWFQQAPHADICWICPFHNVGTDLAENSLSVYVVYFSSNQRWKPLIWRR